MPYSWFFSHCVLQCAIRSAILVSLRRTVDAFSTTKMALSVVASMVAQLGYYEKVAGFLGVISVILLFWKLTHEPFYPALPLAGEPPQRRWFSLSNRLRYYNDCAALFDEAYHTASHSMEEYWIGVTQLTLHSMPKKVKRFWFRPWVFTLR